MTPQKLGTISEQIRGRHELLAWLGTPDPQKAGDSQDLSTHTQSPRGDDFAPSSAEYRRTLCIFSQPE